MTLRPTSALLLVAALQIMQTASAAPPAPTAATGFADVLSQPAQMSPLAAKSPMHGIARAGNRLVAVGQRGHIVVSADDGKTWTQSPVPVSSDLTAVYFVNERKGWVVGHDGVVLASSDGGATWALQLDGPRANTAVLADVERKAAAAPASEPLKAMLAEAKRNVEQGADKPFLDVWFADEKSGYIVGAYNLIFRTEDGGTTWTPWFDRTDNPKFLNLYAIHPVGDGLYVVGESGLALKLDTAAQRFRALDTGYNGTFFGVVGNASAVLAYGLRGSVYRSTDAGKSWTRINVGLPATIVAGVAMPDGTLTLADVSGRLASSADGGATWKPAATSAGTMIAGLTDMGNGALALVGPRGITVTGN